MQITSYIREKPKNRVVSPCLHALPYKRKDADRFSEKKDVYRRVKKRFEDYIHRISFKEKRLLLKFTGKHNYSSMIIPSSEVIKTSDGSFS